MINLHPDGLHAMAIWIGAAGTTLCCVGIFLWGLAEDKLLLSAAAIGIPVFALVAILGLFS